MPELHKLTPFLGILQDKGFKVALVTDGRMSGASGKVPAAIHLVPEAAEGGLLSKLQDGDVIRVDAISGTVMCLEDPDIINALLSSPQPNEGERGWGSEIFAINRDKISNAGQIASYLFPGI